MNSNRRDFLKLTGLAGISLAGASLTGCAPDNQGLFNHKHNQRFNMHGYAAPKIETVRIGVIGVGNRGRGALRRLSRIEGAEIKALGDLVPENLNMATESLKNTSHRPDIYTGNEDEWKKMCERDDIDLIYICTPWDLHTPQAVYAMEHDKHAATEIPAAKTIEECWQLVETSERTRKHCIMLENVCYDFFEMLTLNMVRQGFFGEIVHGEGAYIHDLLEGNFSREKYYNFWRLEENSRRNGGLYVQHGLGPIAQIMNLNTGDQMDYMVSMSSNDFMMNDMAKDLAAEDDFYQKYVDRPYRGNMNTTTIRTKKGKSIMIQHDVTSPRPYSRIHLVSGTKGTALKYPTPGRISTSHRGWFSEEEFKEVEAKYMPEIVKRIGEMARQVGGHGGMDTMMDWRLIDCLRNGIPLDMDVYDAALWSSIGPLSEYSVANRAATVDVPDFTSGAWETNEPGMDMELVRGGTTQIV